MQTGRWLAGPHPLWMAAVRQRCRWPSWCTVCAAPPATAPSTLENLHRAIGRLLQRVCMRGIDAGRRRPRPSAWSWRFPSAIMLCRLRARAAADDADAGHAAHVDELSAAHLCVDDPLLEKNGLINQLPGAVRHSGRCNMINTSGAVVLGMVYNYLPLHDSAACTAIMAKIDQRGHRGRAGPGLQTSLADSCTRVLVPLAVPRHHHGHHHGVRAQRSPPSSSAVCLGRRLQPADRRFEWEAAVPGQFLQPGPLALPSAPGSWQSQGSGCRTLPRNCSSIRSPISRLEPPPSIRLMIKVEHRRHEHHE